MKKLVLCTLFLFLFSFPSFADVLTLLSGVTTTGPGASQWVKDYNNEIWTCDVNVTGTPTAVVVRIEGNMGGTVFDPTGMGTATFTATQLTAQKATFGIVNSPVVNIRANVITFTNGTSISAVCGGMK